MVRTGMADANEPAPEPAEAEPEMTEAEVVTSEGAEIPSEVGPGWGRMKVDYLEPSFEKALPAKKGDIIYVINTDNDDWYGVRNAAGKTGFVPANMVELESAEPAKPPVEGAKYHPMMRRQMRRFLELVAPVRPSSPSGHIILPPISMMCIACAETGGGRVGQAGSAGEH